MPVNLIEIQKSLPDFAQQAKARRGELAEREQELLGLIEKYANQLDAIKPESNKLRIRTTDCAVLCRCMKIWMPSLQCPHCRIDLLC